ncbi:MAG: helix-turn-helix transcriptional regulator [Pseudomonadota bacterium]
MITTNQLRAARALLRIEQAEAAEAGCISRATLSAIENENSPGSAASLRNLQSFYEARGVVFTEDDGVRFNRSGLRRYRGPEDFQRFYDDVYETARRQGGTLSILNGQPEELIRCLGESFYRDHAARMAAIKDRFRFQVIVREGDRALIGAEFAEYRWWPEALFTRRTLYIYGDKVAWIVFEPRDVRVVVQDDREIAEAQRVVFDIAWQHMAQPIDD